jgi:hypothetical protein
MKDEGCLIDGQLLNFFVLARSQAKFIARDTPSCPMSSMTCCDVFLENREPFPEFADFNLIDQDCYKLEETQAGGHLISTLRS